MTLVETFLKLAADARTRTWEIPVDEVPAALAQPNAILIDVQEEEEWREGHVKGAVHLSRGRRSALAADNLQKMGYNNVITIAGGFEAWQNSGLPSESASQSTTPSGVAANQEPS